MSYFTESTSSLALFLLEILLSITLGSVTILPVILILWVTNQIYRFFLSIVLWILYGNDITLINKGYDGMYMYKGHKNGKRMILYFVVMEDPEDINSLRMNYEKHILNQPPYQKLKKIWTKKFGYFCVKNNTPFNVENHVRIYTGLEEDNRRIVTETELMEQILPDLSNDMDESKPQWEDVLIPRFRYDNDNIGNSAVKSVRVFRVHHGYCDGISMLLMLAHSQSEGRDFPWVIHPLTPSTRSWLSELSFCTLSALTLSSTVFKNLWNKPSSMNHRWHVRKFTGETLHGWSKPIQMDLLRKIKKSVVGSSMPGVVCSILTSAVRRFEEKYDSEDPVFAGTFSHEIIIGLVAAMLPYPDLKLRNRHCILKCHLDCRNLTRVDRLRQINKEMKRLSKSPEMYTNYLLPRLFGVMPGWFSDACTSLFGGCGVVSNFPVSSRKIKLWGNEVDDLVGFVPTLTAIGFACVTIRYAEHLRFCLNADKASLTKEKLDFFTLAINEEAELLARECEEMSAKGFSKLSLGANKDLLAVETTDDKNNNNSEYSDQVSRDTRLNVALDKIISSVKKIKNS